MNKMLGERSKLISEHVYLKLPGNLQEPNLSRKQLKK